VILSGKKAVEELLRGTNRVMKMVEKNKRGEAL